MSPIKVPKAVLVYVSAVLLSSALLATPARAPHASAAPARQAAAPSWLHVAGSAAGRDGRRVGWAGLSMSLDSIAALRAVLTEYGRISYRGLASVSMSLQVIDALTAPNEKEYRRRLRSLPVTLVGRTVSADRTRLVVEYRLNGELKTRSFSTGQGGRVRAGSQPGSRSGLSSAVQFSVATSHEPPPSWTHARLASAGICSYTDPEGVHWGGACASTQEINDALVMEIAVQEDVSRMQAEEDAHRSGVCAANPRVCEEEPAPYEDEEEDAAGQGLRERAGIAGFMQAAALTNHDGADDQLTANQFRFASYAPGGPLLVDGPCGSVGEVAEGGFARAGCASHGIGYGVALGTFGFRIWSLATTLAAPAPPASAVGQALGIAVMAAGAVAGTAIALHDCLTAKGGGAGGPGYHQAPT